MGHFFDNLRNTRLLVHQKQHPVVRGARRGYLAADSSSDAAFISLVFSIIGRFDYATAVIPHPPYSEDSIISSYTAEQM